MQGHQARKRFGQNFLVDASVIESIADLVAPRAGERIVEIGPGLGALTNALLARLDASSLPMTVIEIDRDLVERLEKKFGPHKLAIRSGDVLDFNFNALANELGGPLRVVGNLPYNISSPLLFRLAAQSASIVDQHFMLQREVVERMTAQPGTSAFGRLSVMLQLRYAMTTVLDVPPEAFEPAPKVHSAVIRMVPRDLSASGIVDQAVFEEVVTAGFSQRRKMLRNTLAPYFDAIGGAERALEFGILPTNRAEQVAVASWVAFANRVAATR